MPNSLKVLFYQIVFIICTVSTCFAQEPDTTKWITNGTVHKVLQYGNKIYMGGELEYIGPATLSGMPIDSSTGEVIKPFPRMFNGVRRSLPDGNGGWYLAGNPTKVGTLSTQIAHINPDFSVDPSLAVSANNSILCMVKVGNTLYVGGAFTIIGGQNRNRLAAVDLTTGTVLPWNPDSEANVNAMGIIGNVIYVGGDFDYLGGISRHQLGAIDGTTGAITPWNPNSNHRVEAMCISGNTVYVGGYFSGIGALSRNKLAAIDATSGAVLPWNPNVSPSAANIHYITTSGNTLYVGGYFTTIGSISRRNIAAIDLTTGLATSWNPNPDFEVHYILPWYNLIYVGGEFINIGGQVRHRVAALDPISGAANGWNPNINGGGSTGGSGGYFGSTIYTITPFSPGKIFVGGATESTGGLDRGYFTALDDQTGEALSWDFNYPYENSSIAMLGKGNLLYYSEPGKVVAWDTLTGAHTSFAVTIKLSSSSDGFVKALLISGDTLYLGGTFTQVNGQPRTNFAAVQLSTGNLLPLTLNIGNAILGQSVASLAKKDNILYIGGSFQTVGGNPINGLAAINHTSGTLISTWNPNVTGGLFTIRGIIPLNNKLYVGGRFTAIGGTARRSLACLDPVTATATHWNPQVWGTGSSDGVVHSMSYMGDKIYIGGNFNTIDGEVSRNLGEIDTLTGAVSCWNPDVGILESIHAIGGKLNIGGRAITSSLNLMYRWRGFMQYRILPKPSILTSDITGTFCGGNTLDVHFTVNGTINPGNNFTAQLSDEYGGFLNAVDIGTGSSSPISVTIPNVTSGANYKIRIIADNPCIIGGDTNQITILSPPTLPSTITGTSAACIDTINYSVTNVSGTTYAWNVTGGNLISSSNNTATIGWITTGAKTIEVIPTNACGTGTSRTLNLTVNDIPVVPSSISGNISPCIGSTTYSVTPVSGTTYAWSITGGSVVSSSGGSASINWPSTGSKTVTVTPSNTCGNGPSQNLSVTVSTIPAQPSTISGNTIVCLGSQNYSVTNVVGVNYTWSASGGTITSSSANNATVNWTSTGNRSVTVTPSNSCGNGTARSLSVTVSTTPAQPSTISGTTTPCLNSNYNYSVTTVAGVTYTWSTAGGTVISSSGNSATIRWTSTGSQTLTVTPSNTCGDGPARNLTVNVITVPAQPSTITGNTTPCQNVNTNYSVTSVSGVTYAWSATGATIVSTSGSSAVIRWTGTGSQTLTVTPSNTCGNGTASTLAVNIGTLPAQPGIISGNTSVCPGTENYDVPLVAGVTYTWGATGGTVTSSSSNTVSISWPGSGSKTVSVTPSNACGNGTARTLGVNVNTVPAQPGTISGTTITCLGNDYTYTVPLVAGVSYSWSATGGTVVSSSANTVTVNWSTQGNNSITVTPSNSCGNGTARTVSVLTNTVPTQPGSITGNMNPCLTNSYSYAIPTVSGVSYQWTTSGGSIPVSNTSTVQNSWQSPGTQTLSVTPSNSCGSGTPSTANVTVISPPMVDAGNDTIVNFGSELTLNGCCGNHNYLWSPNSYLSSNTLQNPLAKPTEEITYTLVITDQYGCNASDNVTISVNKAFNIFIPNMFSPNADGNNDEFKLYGFGIKTILFEVYNKWGLKLYSTENVEEILTTGWNGTSEDKKVQPPGTYVWKISGEFLDGSPLQYLDKKTGTVLIVD